MPACKNCSQSFEGYFCPVCGQKAHQVPFTFSHLKALVWDNFDFDKGFLFTFMRLFSNPGQVIKDYLSGVTVRYTNPVKYILTIVTVLVLIEIFSGKLSEWYDLNKGFDDLRTPGDGSELNNYLLLLPSALFFWLTNMICWRGIYTKTEHFLIVLYEVSQAAVIPQVFIVIERIAEIFGIKAQVDMRWVGAMILLAVFYPVWFNLRVWPGSKFSIVWKTLVSFIAGFLIFLAIIAIGVYLVNGKLVG